MSDLVHRDAAGHPVFGEAALEGWAFAEVGRPADRERTLRNAILAALQAEHQGDGDRAYRIWTHQLGEGQCVWQAVVAALPDHVAYLGGQAAGYHLTPEAVQAEVERLTAAYGGKRPALTKQHDAATGVQRLVWDWAGGNWYGVEVNHLRLARQLRARPLDWVSPLGDRLAQDCTDRHPESPFAKPHTVAECGGRTMADHLGADLPPDPGLPTSAPSSAPCNGGSRRASAKLTAFLAVVNTAEVKQQRRAKTYRPCLVCQDPIDVGDHYVTVTGRRRAHVACAETAKADLAAGEKVTS